MGIKIHSIGTLVSINSYGPYFGCAGTIRGVEVIDADGKDPLPFYLVALHEDYVKEPLWFEHDAVADKLGSYTPIFARGEVAKSQR